jgi:hypothetical protein
MHAGIYLPFTTGRSAKFDGSIAWKAEGAGPYRARLFMEHKSQPDER